MVKLHQNIVNELNKLNDHLANGRLIFYMLIFFPSITQVIKNVGTRLKFSKLLSHK